MLNDAQHRIQLHSLEGLVAKLHALVTAADDATSNLRAEISASSTSAVAPAAQPSIFERLVRGGSEAASPTVKVRLFNHSQGRPPNQIKHGHHRGAIFRVRGGEEIAEGWD